MTDDIARILDAHGRIVDVEAWWNCRERRLQRANAHVQLLTLQEEGAPHRKGTTTPWT
jgi:hypothetical protein